MVRVAVIMGSASDFNVVKRCIETLKELSIPFEVRVMSAHRTLSLVVEYASTARDRGIGVIIAAAGKAAHLAGVVAACTCVPVIGLPIKSSTLDGLDSLLSTVQMPRGVPVASVAIDGAENAALLAGRILSITDVSVYEKLETYAQKLKSQVLQSEKVLLEGGI